MFTRKRSTARWIASLVACALVALVVRALDHGSHQLMQAANIFAVVDWVMQESLDLLVNKLSVASHFNTEVQREFERDFAPGETVRVKFPQEYLIRNGLQYDNTNNPLNRRTTTVACDQIFGIDFQYDSFEQALKMERGKEILSREYLKPAMVQLAQEIEDRCTNWATQNTSNIVGTLGTDPATFDATSAAARQRMVELGCPTDDRCIVVPPAVMRALKNSNISYFNPVSDISKMMRTGIVGYGDGFDWYESAGLYTTTASVWATPSAVTYSSGAADGATSIVVNCTNGDTFVAGTPFSMAACNQVNPRTRRKPGTSLNRQFVMAGNVTATAATATITFSPPMYGPGSQYQNVDALPAANALLTQYPGTTTPATGPKAGINGLAIGRDAFALVGVKFENPKEGGSIEIARQLKDDETGLTISLLRYFDGDARVWKTRFDTCLGFGNLYNGNNAVRIACA